MKVCSKEKFIALLDEALCLADQLNTQLDEMEHFMKDHLCYNTPASSGAPRLP